MRDVDRRLLLLPLGQESLWEAPVYETSVKDYINYMEDLEKKDPDCEEHNAAQCPRFFGFAEVIFRNAVRIVVMK